MGERVLDLLRQGLSYNAIVAEIGCSKPNVNYYAKKLGTATSLRRYDWQAVQAYHEQGNNISKYRKHFGFSTDAWDKAVERGELKARPWQIPLETLLVNGRKIGRRHLKNRMLRAEILQDHCQRCGLTHWIGEKLSLELHHVNGSPDDNHLENLNLLCSNCHSLTPNYCGKNKKRTATICISV